VVVLAAGQPAQGRAGPPYGAAWTAPAAAGAIQKNDTLLFMGAERPNTNGDSNAGFWLFKNQVLCNTATGTFSGAHANGDLFLVGSFTSGGSSATLASYT
jgi:hypothetical protein